MKEFKLDQTPKINSGFKVPDNYFDNLEIKIINQLAKDNVKEISIFGKSYLWLSGIAAVMIIGFSISVLFKNAEQTSFTNEDYLFTHENLNTEDFAEFLSENDLQMLEKKLIK